MLFTCDIETGSCGKANYQINAGSMQLNGVLQKLLILLPDFVQ